VAGQPHRRGARHPAFFGRFKYFVDHEFSGSTVGLLKLLHAQARTYESWVREAYGKNPTSIRSR
jgi:hypothetical protein